MHIAINMDYGKKKLNKKGVRMMQITKETVITVVVHTYIHTRIVLKILKTIIIKAIFYCPVDLLTQGDIVLSFCV